MGFDLAWKLQGLKPVEVGRLMSELKLRPTKPARRED